MKIGLQMLFHSMPALLKCDLVPIVPNAILDVLLSIIFGAVFRLVFGVPPFEDLPVYRCFLCLGQRLGPLLDQFWTPF